MLTIIICAVVLFLAVSAAEGFGPGLLAGLAGALIGLCAATFIGMFVYMNAETWKPDAPVILTSLGDNMGVEGHFFLGSGSVDGVPTFTWYQQTGPNDYVRKSVNADESTIHYITDGKKPRVVKWSKCDRNKTFGTLLVDANAGCWNEHYDFYVPKGSIVQSYTLDNK